jgi:formylmethanofuran dehydrogenase subunit E
VSKSKQDEDIMTFASNEQFRSDVRKRINAAMPEIEAERQVARRRIQAGFDERKARGWAKADAMLNKQRAVEYRDVVIHSERGRNVIVRMPIPQVSTVCNECGESRPDDDRVKAGMKCGQCVY